VTSPPNPVRTAVRRFLEAVPVECGVVCVACSGGTDSLALAEATVHHARLHDLAVHGLVVDHGLQPGSAAIARHAAQQLGDLGCATVEVLAVRVDATTNVEAAARAARYAALEAARPHPDALVLLGHTLDDQAETVLLGLGRGSGPRSIAGMRELDPPWARPLLSVRRADTAAACATLGLDPWHDPHNVDPRFRRARLRAEVMPLLENVLGGGVAPALARTAAQLREDCDALDALATDLLTAAGAPTGTPTDGGPSGGAAPDAPADDARGQGVGVPRDRGASALTDGGPGGGAPNDREAGAPNHREAGAPRGQGAGDLGGGLDAEVLAAAPSAVRRRAIRAWLLAGGATDLTDGHLRSVDALVGAWRGQGAVALPGQLEAYRAAGRLLLRPGPTPTPTNRPPQPPGVSAVS